MKTINQQCTALITPAYSVFAMGGKPKPKRCTNNSDYMVIEKSTEQTMGLCENCLIVFRKANKGDEYEVIPNAV